MLSLNLLSPLESIVMAITAVAPSMLSLSKSIHLCSSLYHSRHDRALCVHLATQGPSSVVTAAIVAVTSAVAVEELLKTNAS